MKNDKAYILIADDEKEIRDILPCRYYNSNKGSYGKALITAGSFKMPGAAVIR